MTQTQRYEIPAATFAVAQGDGGPSCHGQVSTEANTC